MSLKIGNSPMLLGCFSDYDIEQDGIEHNRDDTDNVMKEEHKRHTGDDQSLFTEIMKYC